MQPGDAEPDGPQTFDEAEQVGAVELDRYCAGCGYNLRQQPVRREPGTKLLLCRCPECGAFEPANHAMSHRRAWFGQLVLLLWLTWFAMCGGALAGAVSMTFAIAYECSQNRLDSYRLAEPIVLPPRPGSTATRTINYGYRLADMTPETAVETAVYFTAAAGIGALLTGLATVLIPHWPRKAYIGLSIGWPLATLAAVLLVVMQGSGTMDHATDALRFWVYLSTIMTALLAINGGLVAVWLGRPTARLIVRMLIPPKRRGPFAYLWLVDGKAQPGTTT